MNPLTVSNLSYNLNPNPNNNTQGNHQGMLSYENNGRKYELDETNTSMVTMTLNSIAILVQLPSLIFELAI